MRRHTYAGGRAPTGTNAHTHTNTDKARADCHGGTHLHGQKMWKHHFLCLKLNVFLNPAVPIQQEDTKKRFSLIKNITETQISTGFVFTCFQRAFLAEKNSLTIWEIICFLAKR